MKLDVYKNNEKLQVIGLGEFVEIDTYTEDPGIYFMPLPYNEKLQIISSELLDNEFKSSEPIIEIEGTAIECNNPGFRMSEDK